MCMLHNADAQMNSALLVYSQFNCNFNRLHGMPTKTELWYSVSCVFIKEMKALAIVKDKND